MNAVGEARRDNLSEPNLPSSMVTGSKQIQQPNRITTYIGHLPRKVDYVRAKKSA